MKKFICLLMVALLVMAVSVTAFAHGDACDACGSIGTVVREQSIRMYNDYCPYVGSHRVTERYEVFICRSCDYIADQNVISRVITCSHCN